MSNPTKANDLKESADKSDEVQHAVKDDNVDVTSTSDTAINPLKRRHSNSDDDDDDPEDVVTLHDMIEQMDRGASDAMLLLGGSDEDNCTYDKGYMARQMLYSCLTCAQANGGRHVGVCVACSQNCHDSHDLVELYTKRNFRCDCGTQVCGTDFKCTMRVIDTSNMETNVGNSYAYNFDGLYCTCKKHYPSEDNNEAMVQCNICEDWFHVSCLSPNLKQEDVDKCKEITCGECVKQYPVLLHLKNAGEATTSTSEESRKICLTGATIQNEVQVAQPIIWTFDLRAKLCSCEHCKAYFESKAIAYLLNPLDLTPTKEGDEADESSSSDPSFDRAMELFNTILPPSVQRDVLYGYKAMVADFVAFVQTLPQDHVITKTDILGFFDRLRAKRARLMASKDSIDAPHTA